MNRGKQALGQGERREAAIAYAHAAQIEPSNPAVHLGLAEANLALGSYGVVYMACRKVQELQPEGGVESTMAQALLNLLDRRYDRALQDVDAAISQDPGNGYAHALRSYLLRINGQDYDANLARARAARLSYGGHYDNCFPPVEPVVTPAYSGVPPSSTTLNGNGEQVGDPTATVGQREAIPTWSRPNGMQRQIVRTRFAISQHPRLVTNILIGINVAVYLILAFLSRSVDINTSVLLAAGAQCGNPQCGPNVPYEYWRIFTAMFLHFNIFHIGLNMLSLFFIGTAGEVFFGKWRYLVIYLALGIFGGIATQIPAPNSLAAGASGRILCVFCGPGFFLLF